jgi:hypothetical protein
MTAAVQTPDLSSGVVGNQAPSSSSQPSTPALDPLNLASGKVGSHSEDPGQTGYLMNDVGNRVTVPKDGESFNDTVKRAIQYHKSLPPEQQEQALQREVATIPKKAGQVLAGAGAIGVGGPAALAGVGEAGAAIGEALPQVIPTATAGVQAITAWAAKNPLHAYMLYQVMKELLPGAKKAIGVVKEAPDGE